MVDVLQGTFQLGQTSLQGQSSSGELAVRKQQSKQQQLSMNLPPLTFAQTCSMGTLHAG
jgi:hypothetical protein